MLQDKDKSHKKPAARKRSHKDTSRAGKGAPDKKAVVSVCRFLVVLATIAHFFVRRNKQMIHPNPPLGGFM